MTAAKAKSKSKAKGKARAKARARTRPRAKVKAKTKTKTRTKTKTKAKAKAPTPAPAKPVKVTPALRKRALAIVDGLGKQHPDAHCELDFTNGLELLIATILAAQCTDKRVNIVTKDLFKKYRTAQDYVRAKDEVLQEEIRTTGFFRNKTKSIKKACQSLIDEFDGKIPEKMDDLLKLAGVGRKTANVILANVFGVPGIVVDTHMLRITKRMDLSHNTDPVKVEHDIMAVLPESEWIRMSHLIPWHGRRVCPARKPLCDECGAAHACPKQL